MRLTGLVLLGALEVAQAGAFPASPRAAVPEAKIEAVLGARAAAGDTATVAVWLELHDKGLTEPEDLAAALTRAERALTPRARARRLRAGVTPLVDERDLPVSAGVLAALEARGLRPLAVSRWFNRAAFRVRLDRLAELAALPEVRRIVSVRRVRSDADVPVDGLLPRRMVPRRTAGSMVDPGSYGRMFDALDQVRLPELHACGFDGRGVLVCMLDDGFPFRDRHEALRDARIAPGHVRDFVDGDTSVAGGSGHGTLVMGVIAGHAPGAYVGAAPGASFALARTERSASETPQEMLFWGMAAEWADSLGADVISSSVGYFDFDGTASDYAYEDMDGQTTDVTRAAQIAAAKGILVVNAVGNYGQFPWRHLIAPADANGDSVLAIGAVDAFGDTAAFSSAGPSADGRVKPDLVARGVFVPVVSTSDPGAYGVTSGTSLSAPLVAGLAACLMQAQPDWTPVRVIQALRASASRATRPDNKSGYGIPDALAALHDGAPSVRGNTFALSRQGLHPLRIGSSTARFTLGVLDPTAGTVDARLLLVDVRGRAVRTLWRGTLCPGRSEEAVWDGSAGDGRSIEPGVYWAVLEGGGRHRGVRVVATR